MADDDETTILAVRRFPDGSYLVTDGEQREHHANDQSSLGGLVAKLCVDPEIRRTRTASTEIDPVVGLVSKLTRKMRPDLGRYVDAIEPLAHIVAGEAKKPRTSNGKRRRRGSGRAETR